MVAAKKRGDEEMISKLSGYEDLFAYDAKYHKTCYSQYISQRNIKYSFKINESINAKKNADANDDHLEVSSSSLTSSDSNRLV